MSTPALSVVIPTRNRGELCRLAVESCLAETDVELEVIVVDDGSTDNTAAALAGLPIRYLHQQWAGRSAARNRGIAAAGAPLIAFLDSDDLCVPGRFARQLASLAPDAVAGWGQVALVDDDGAPLPAETAVIQREIAETAARGATPEQLAVRMRIYPSTVIVRREAVATVGGFDEALFVAEDIQWLLRLRRHGGFSYEPQPVALIRRHAGNSDAGEMFRVSAEFTAKLAREASAPDDGPYRARLHYFRARALWSLGENGAARAAGRAALRDDLSVVLEPGFLKRHALSLLPAPLVNPWRPELRRARPK